MKQFDNKVFYFNKKKAEETKKEKQNLMSYLDMFKAAADFCPPQEGLKPSEIKKRLKIQEILESKKEYEVDPEETQEYFVDGYFEMEDADAKSLKEVTTKALEAGLFRIVHKSIVALDEDLKNWKID